MKKIILLSVLITLFFVAKLPAQENSIKKFLYCEIVGTQKFMSTKVNIVLDFGQATSFFSDNKRLRGEDGKLMVFNSMVDAMNWMGNDGWEFVQAYVVTVGNQSVYHWLLKKDTSSLSDDELQELISKFKTSKD